MKITDFLVVRVCSHDSCWIVVDYCCFIGEKYNFDW